MSKFPELALSFCLCAGTASGAGLGLGRTATDAEVAAWDIDVRPDGQGLPEGSGDVATGETLYTDLCAACHGDFGEGIGRWPVLSGGRETLEKSRPVKTIGSYWPYLSTVYDYINRAMPFGNGQSLTPDQVYAITAYLLYLNDLVSNEAFVLDRDSFAEVTMPNADGFLPDERAELEIPQFSEAPCMSACKTDVVITEHASILDVTPDE